MFRYAVATEYGASLVEYGIVLAVVAAVAFEAVSGLGEEVSSALDAGTLSLASYTGNTPDFDPDAFVLEVHTEKFRVFPSSGGAIEIDWGSEEANALCGTSFVAGPSVSCEYPNFGRYFISITGDLQRYGYATDENTNEDLVRVMQWGNTGLTSLRQAFRGATSLQSVPSHLPPTVSTLTNAFRSAENFNDKSVSSWDVSNVTGFGGMFAGARAFNQPLDGWDTSMGTTFNYMFHGAFRFNQDISGWDTSSAVDMSQMFLNASSFSGDLSGWCVSNILSPPPGFKTASAMTGEPVWGSCPL
mgnify:CR=1 FL=1